MSVEVWRPSSVNPSVFCPFVSETRSFPLRSIRRSPLFFLFFFCPSTCSLTCNFSLVTVLQIIRSSVSLSIYRRYAIRPVHLVFRSFVSQRFVFFQSVSSPIYPEAHPSLRPLIFPRPSLWKSVSLLFFPFICLSLRPLAPI